MSPVCHPLSPKTSMNLSSRLLQLCLAALVFLTLLLSGASAVAQTKPGGSYDIAAPTALPPPPEGEVNGAALYSQSVPTSMVAGSTYNVSVTMRNTGSTVWTSYDNYNLGSLSPQNNQTWGIARISVGTTPVNYWDLKTFSFQVTAPSTPGSYTFHFGMLEEYREWFGTTSPVTVTVTAPAPVNNAQIISSSAPSNMVTGQGYDVSVTVKNTGTTTWKPGVYRLGSQNPTDNSTWGFGRVDLPVNVLPGQQYQFAFRVTAPAPGSYSMQWKMLEEYVQWFGGTSSNAISVGAATPKPTISVTGATSLTAGQSFTTSWSTTNATSLKHVCTAAGTGYNVNESLAVNGSRSQVAQSGWVNYPSTCTWTATGAGGTTTFSRTLTTSAAASPAPTVSVQRTPSTMTAGQSFTLTWSTTNATSLTRVCTASGTGFTGNESLPVNGSASGTASASWVGYPSTCTWTASGSGGSKQYAETMTTVAPAASGVTYIHTDGLGSPVARTNASGQLISTTRYEPYGYVASGAAPTIGFTGHVNDADTGLTYMQQRYYDPVAGRFLSIDPVSTDASTGGSFNRYAYAANNPYRYIDPDGRAIETPWDAANVAMDIVSLSRNLAVGNYGGATVDAIGLIYDGFATAVPGLPAGAGAAIKASRSAGDVIKANKAAGDAFSAATASKLKSTSTEVAEEVTVRTASGVKTRVDIMSRDAAGKISCHECKASATAPLTKNQKAAHPEIAASGAVVVGKGKPGFPAGTVIPPQEVKIIRPIE